MKRTARCAIALAFSAICGLAVAQDGPTSQIPDAPEAAQLKEAMRTKVEAVRRLPLSGVSMVDASDGRTYVVSDNGRFVFLAARVIDLWNGKEIRNGNDAMAIANSVDLKQIGLKLEDLNTFTYGTGKKEVVVFVDTQCPYCKTLLKQMPAIAKTYQFKIVVLPLLGQKSAEESKALSCMANKREAAEKIVNGDIANLGAGQADCDTLPIQRSLISAKVLGIEAVPYIITHENRMQRGGVKDLAQFLSTGQTGYGPPQKKAEGK